jgi:hypothetical protein
VYTRTVLMPSSWKYCTSRAQPAASAMGSARSELPPDAMLAVAWDQVAGDGPGW